MTIFRDLAEQLRTISREQRDVQSGNLEVDRICCLAARQFCDRFESEESELADHASKFWSKPSLIDAEGERRWWGSIWGAIVDRLAAWHPEQLPLPATIGAREKVKVRYQNTSFERFKIIYRPERWRDRARDYAMVCWLLADLVENGRPLPWRVPEGSEQNDSANVPTIDDSGNAKPVHKPDGWTRGELVAAVVEHVQFSPRTFDRIRVDAGIPPATKDGRGAQRRFSRSDVRRLIDAAKGRRAKKDIEKAWRELLEA